MYISRKEKYDDTDSDTEDLLQIPSSIEINKVNLTPDSGVQLIDPTQMPVRSRYEVPLFQATSPNTEIYYPSVLIMNDSTYFIDENSFAISTIFSNFFPLVGAWVNCDISSCQQMLYAPAVQQYFVLENGQPFSLSPLEGTSASIVNTYDANDNTYRAIKTLDGQYFITMDTSMYTSATVLSTSIYPTDAIIKYTSTFQDGSLFFGQNNNSVYFKINNLVFTFQESSFGLKDYTYDTAVFLVGPNTQQFLGQLLFSSCLSTCKTNKSDNVMVPYKINRIVVRTMTNSVLAPYVFSIDAQNGLQAAYIKRTLLAIGAVPHSLYGQTDIENQLYQEKIRMKDEQEEYADAYKKGYQSGSTQRCKGVPSSRDSIFGDICSVISIGAFFL